MANHVEYQKRILPSAFVFSHSPGPNALWHSPCGMLRLFELVDGNPRRVRTTFKRIFNIGIIYAHPSNNYAHTIYNVKSLIKIKVYVNILRYKTTVGMFS